MPVSSSPSPSAKRSQPLTLRQLFDTEETPLLRYAFSLIGRRAIAEEIVQEVFLQLHTHWDDVEQPRAWLFRSVRNRAYNHQRKHKNEILTDDQENQPNEDQDEAPDALLLRMEAAGYLRLIVEELDDVDRQLVELKYFDDLKYRDISEQTGLSISNVGYRLHHILKELAEKLRQLGIDGTS
ncbi:MAG: RNA polymerase sigma factor [Verrucomicrobiales bacterium]|nr:RNA polymerase sigma factor [Verrucomicrobiales bacterium]